MKKIFAIIICIVLTFTACSATTQSPETTTTTTTPITDKQEKTDNFLDLMIGEDYFSDYSDDYGVLYDVSHQYILTQSDCTKKYPRLATALENHNQQNSNDVWQVYEDYADWVETEISEGSFASPYTYESKTYVQRSDADILSFYEHVYSYTGGVHPNSGVSTVNIDPMTGKMLALDDIVNDIDALVPVIVTAIVDKYPFDPFDGLDKTLGEYTAEDFKWTVDYQSITFYFAPYEIAPYAAGLLSATIWFDEHPQLFDEKYTKHVDNFALMLMPLEMHAFDVDKDDLRRDFVTVDADMTNKCECYTQLRIAYNGDEIQCDNLEFFEFTPYLVCQDGKFFIYIDTLGYNDYHTLRIFSIEEERIVSQAEIGGTGISTEWVQMFENNFYKIITDPDAFLLDTRIDLLSTQTSTNTYKADAVTGIPQNINDYYALEAKDMFALTSKIDLTVEILPSGEKETLPANTEFLFLRTDNKTYVDMKLPDQRECRLYVTFDGYSLLVNGIDQYECFDGLMYAG